LNAAQEHSPEQGKRTEARLPLSRMELQQALARGGCLICSALRRFERRTIHSFLYEGMMSADVRKQFLDTGGFCVVHFDMAIEIERESWPEGGIGLALLAEDLLRVAGRNLQHSTDAREAKPGLRRRRAPSPFRPGLPCMVCDALPAKEAALLETLEDCCDEEPFRSGIEARGMCFHHAELAASTWTAAEHRAWIASLTEAMIAALEADLRQLIRRHDHDNGNGQSGQEDDSVLRSMRFLLGDQRYGVAPKGAR